MMDVDEKAMAYCLIEALFAAGLLNLPTYQNTACPGSREASAENQDR